MKAWHGEEAPFVVAVSEEDGHISVDGEIVGAIWRERDLWFWDMQFAAEWEALCDRVLGCPDGNRSFNELKLDVEAFVAEFGVEAELS